MLRALAGLRANLLDQSARVPDTPLLPGGFARVQQAIRAARTDTTSAACLEVFIENVLRTGFVQRLIDRHQVQGLDAASPGGRSTSNAEPNGPAFEQASASHRGACVGCKRLQGLSA
jgi:hypothetical protein